MHLKRIHNKISDTIYTQNLVSLYYIEYLLKKKNIYIIIYIYFFNIKEYITFYSIKYVNVVWIENSLQIPCLFFETVGSAYWTSNFYFLTRAVLLNFWQNYLNHIFVSRNVLYTRIRPLILIYKQQLSTNVSKELLTFCLRNTMQDVAVCAS